MRKKAFQIDEHENHFYQPDTEVMQTQEIRHGSETFFRTEKSAQIPKKTSSFQAFFGR